MSLRRDERVRVELGIDRARPPVFHGSECDGRRLTRIGPDDLPRVSASAAVIEQGDGGASDRFSVGILEYVDAMTGRTVEA